MGNTHVKMFYADGYHSGSGVAVWENDYLHKRLLENLRRFPGYKFVLEEEGWTFWDWLQDPPEFLGELEAAAKQGSIEFVNGTYSQPLIEVLGLESNIRQLLWGKRLAKKIFGVDIVTYANQEHALHVAMPQILKLLGYKHVLLRTHLPYWGYTPQLDKECFQWTGLDGTEIPAVPVYTFQYYGSYGSPAKTPTGYGSSRCYITTWPPSFAKDEMVSRAKNAGIMRPLFTRFTDIVRDRIIADSEIRRILSDPDQDFTLLKDYIACEEPKESIALSQDLFDTVGFWGLFGDEQTKDYKKVEQALLTAEQLSLIAWYLGGRHLPLHGGWIGGKHYLDELHVGWLKLFFSQQHDAEICAPSGFGGRTLVSRTRAWTRQALCLAQEAIEEGLYQIGIRVQPREGPYGARIVVFNALSWPRSDVAETDAEFEPGSIHDLAVKDGGTVVPSHVVVEDRYSDGSIRRVKVKFLASDVGPIGYKVFHIVDSPEKPSKGIAESETSIENGTVKVTYDAKGIQSIYLKSKGKELVKPGETCAYLRGFQGDRNQWVDSRQSVESVKLLGSSPLHATVRIEGKTAAFSYVTDATLSTGVERIDFKTTLRFEQPTYMGRHPSDEVARKQNRLHYLEEMYEEDEKLRVFFPLNIEGGEVAREIVYAASITQRDWITAHDWVDISKGDVGATLVNTGNQRYVYRKDGVLSLVLAYGGRFFTGANLRDTLLEGIYNFKYALVPHEVRDYGMISRKSREVNVPLVAYAIMGPPNVPGAPSGFGDRETRRRVTVRKRGAYPLPQEASFLSLEGGSATISTFKWEDGAVLVRLYENEGKQSNVRLRVNIRHGPSRAWVVNLLGESIEELPVKGKAVKFPLKPWEIKTLRFEMAHVYAPVHASVGPHFDPNDPYPSLEHEKEKMDDPEEELCNITTLQPR